ncbi:hypothetical protein [Oceanobacillus jeddahense]|uniref:hypothetical protein n=1 Tax=Oceanobacillus jeddahense TaxID=1462527 RepID=UPI003643E875
MTILDEFLKSPNIPYETKKMIDSLDDLGKEAFNAYLDENSNFRQHAQIENISKKFYADPEKIVDLYHYTTYDAFKKIVSSQKFFLGSIHHMNDIKEMSYAFELLGEELTQLKSPQALLDEIKSIKTRVPWDVYIWCFSENDYSQSLQNYGEIALGFKSQIVMDTLAAHFSKGAQTLDDFTVGNAYVFPLKVEYNLQVQTEFIKPIAKVLFSAYKNYSKDPEDMGEIISACEKAIYLCSLCFKDPHLRQEEEIRYLIIKINDDSNLNPEFHLGNKPFVSCEITPDTLEKVILSKKITSKIEETESFLKNGDFTMTHVESTKLPY